MKTLFGNLTSPYAVPALDAALFVSGVTFTLIKSKGTSEPDADAVQAAVAELLEVTPESLLVRMLGTDPVNPELIQFMVELDLPF